MAEPRIAPYGSWESPVSARQIAESSISLGQVAIREGAVYWTEVRPAEAGRSVVVRCGPDGQPEDLVPAPFNARTRVHEYGGGAYLPTEDGVIFANFADQGLYEAVAGGEVRSLAVAEGLRFADFVADPIRRRLIAVCEDHRSGGEPSNSIVAVSLTGRGSTEVLAEGRDFCAAPRLSPDGSRLTWLAWDHPNMPWDAAELWVAGIAPDGGLAEPQRIAGGRGESCAQPVWAPDGSLFLVCDRTDWWNLYRWTGGTVEPVTDLEAEFTPPLWVFGTSTYGFVAPDRIACAYCRDGVWHLALVDGSSKGIEDIACPYTSIGSLATGEGTVCFIGGAPDRPSAVVRWEAASGRFDVLREASSIHLGPGCLSRPEPIDFPSDGGRTAHALFYPPRNDAFAAPEGELPPVVVRVHGGPTAATSTSLELRTQYFTSRGFAVLEVNYGGSTGYGRRYRESLYGQWGIVDVEDSCNAALYLAEAGRVDGSRMAISGGSAGGYTVLCCLSMRDTFAAGASYFGVSDLEVLARDTHKFESRYLDQLVGPYPERRDLYVERSPIHHVDGLSCPVIFLQGLEDRIVPPNQAQVMADALREKGIPVAHVTFEGEQHGFRQAANIRAALEAELYFFCRVFAITPADALPPVAIDNA